MGDMMASKGLSLGDISGFLQFAKLAGGGIVITDFSVLFSTAKSLLLSTGQLTPVVAAQLDLAEAALKANPGLLEIGKGTFVATIDAIVAKYPPTTLLSDIPELGGTITPPIGGGGVVAPTPVTTTVPSSVIYSFLNGGLLPNAEKLASLADFAKIQFDAYKAAGVARAEIGPYEALGRGFADTVQFKTKYGTQNTGDFVTSAYKEVFERAATGAQVDHFKGQVSYFESLYKTAGMATVVASLLAKGAILGQMLGFAALDEASLHPYIAAATKGLGVTSSKFESSPDIHDAPVYDLV